MMIQGLGSKGNRAILLAESHKLDPLPLDECPRPKSGKLRLNLHGTILEGTSIGSSPKKTSRRVHYLENPNAS
jgi:hypothetical protein